MNHHEFLVSQSNVFGGFEKPFGKADYVVFGVPFDVTSTYRTGARFGPNAIRQASLNIETYSFRTSVDVEDLLLHDSGDLHVTAETEETLERVELVVRDLLKKGKTPVAIGGEHTLTFGSMKGLGNKVQNTAIVSFDAHLDLRNEFMSLRLSHATFMRRISEQAESLRIIEVGTRAVCKEELNYARKAGINFFTTHQIREIGDNRIVEKLKEQLADCKSIYLSVDMDVLDPAYAPAVQNPEPEGIDMHALLNILKGVCDKRVVGFDVVEVAPNYDQGVSAIQAAKVIFEILCNLEKAEKTES